MLIVTVIRWLLPTETDATEFRWVVLAEARTAAVVNWFIECFNCTDPIYYANNLFVNIYALIQSNIVRAALFNVILEEGHDMWLGWCEGHRLLVINHYTGWDGLPLTEFEGVTRVA